MILDATFTETKQIINGEFGVLTRGEKGEKGDKGDKGDPGYVNINDSSVVDNETWSSKKIAQELTDLDYAPAIELDGSGEVITLRDSSNRPLRGLNIYGKTTQFTTTGKNLLNVPEKLTFTQHKTITVGLPANTYVISCGNVVKGGDENPILGFLNSAGDVVSYVELTPNSTNSITCNNTPTIGLYSSGWYGTSAGVTSTIEQLMISVDGGEYEPYTGGIPSPNPDYPQELESVGMSKNLLDFEACLKAWNAVYTKDGEKYTITDIWSGYSKPARLFEEQTVVSVQAIVKSVTATNARVEFGVLNDDGTFTSYVNLDSSTTLKSNVTINAVRLNANGSFTVENIQVEKGTVATPYEPYGKGNIGVTVLGKNLFDESQILKAKEWTEKDGVYSGTIGTFESVFGKGLEMPPFLPNTQYTFSLYGYVDSNTGGERARFVIEYTDGSRSYLTVYETTWTKQTITTDAKKSVAKFWFTYGSSNVTVMHIKNLQVEIGAETEYEPYKAKQTLTAQTPNGLPSIGDVRDEIDFAKGVYVQRFDEVDMGTLNWTSVTLGSTSTIAMYSKDLVNLAKWPSSTTAPKILCSHYPVRTTSAGERTDKSLYMSYTNGRLYVRDSAYMDADVFKAAMSGAMLLYELKEPVYHDLSPEELAQYSALHTNKPNTTVFNDANAYMELDYVADTKAYIDQKLAAISAAMLNV